MSFIPIVESYVRLTRPQNASGSVLTFCIGFFLLTSTLSFDFFIGLLILLALHSLATVQNDIEDFDIDRANRRDSVLQDKSLMISRAKYFVQALGLISVGVAILSPHRRLHFAVIAGALVIAWSYNLGPIRGSKRPIISILTMGACYGALPFIYGYLVAGGGLTDRYLISMAIFWFLARVSTSIMKDYKDAAGDRAFKKDTFYLHYGRQATAWVSLATATIAYSGLIVTLLNNRQTNGGFLAAISLAGILAVRNLISRSKLIDIKSEAKLNSIFHKSVFQHNQFEAAVLLCLILS